KRAAVDQVLQSTTFLRAGQLRNFLRYICEMDLAGRAAELSEYLIGVEALGRPAGYSTADDSSVRRRAHALRQKLDEVYATELAGAPVRVDLPKGSYVPRFVRTSPPAAQDDVAGGPITTLPTLDERPMRATATPILAAFAVGLLAASAVWLVARSGAPRV